MALSKTNIRAYYDDDSDPTNPGYVVAWDTLAQRTLTAALDAEDRETALAEAAVLLGVARSAIAWEA